MVLRKVCFCFKINILEHVCLMMVMNQGKRDRSLEKVKGDEI